MNLGDLYYIFFRHKWKILLIFLAGLLGSVGYYLVKPPLYQSEAKILIRYIVEGKTTTSAKDDSQLKSPDSRGDNIINSEIEILTSFDLATLVADAVGPEKILAKLGGGNDRLQAAVVIRRGLTVDAPGRSSVLLLTFRHPDASVVQPVLSQLADTYLKRHVEIHQGVGVMDDFFLRQADQLRARLATTDAELKKLKTELQVVSLDESKRASMDLIVRLRQELMTAEADLAEHRALLGVAGPICSRRRRPPPTPTRRRWCLLNRPSNTVAPARIWPCSPRALRNFEPSTRTNIFRSGRSGSRSPPPNSGKRNWKLLILRLSVLTPSPSLQVTCLRSRCASRRWRPGSRN
ncbi:MAG: Wzz/FepE/Etk N-terminal domain-containing protein [Verrucomicrobiota bacterium]